MMAPKLIPILALVAMAIPAQAQILPSGGYLIGKIEEEKKRNGEDVLNLSFKNTGKKTLLVEWEIQGSETVAIPGGYTEVSPSNYWRVFDERKYINNGGAIGTLKIIRFWEI